MAYPDKVKVLATKYRRSGHSIKEISSILKISVSTASVWLNSIELDQKAQKRLKNRKILGQYKSRLIQKNKSKQLRDDADALSLNIINKVIVDSNLSALLCSFLYWAEGGKTGSHMSFSNSDLKMISTFMILFRSAYNPDENKFRCLVHIHEYHDDKEIKRFWSEVTGIPLAQFTKSYLKPHTKKRKKENYKGTVRISYYDSKIAVKIKSLYNTFTAELELRGVA